MHVFKLSRFITTTPLQGEYDAPIPEQFQHDHFLLKDNNRGKEFLINSTVHYFISKFSQPRSLPELIQLVQQDVQAMSPELEKSCRDFFDFLCSKSILVPQDEVEEENQIERFLKPGDVFKNFLIESVLSDRGHIEIYLAADTVSKEQFVIKLLNHNKFDNDEEYEEELYELEREYQMMKNVGEISFVCNAYHFEKHHNHAFIQLEYIKGLSINKFLKTNENISKMDSLLIINNFLSGFAGMHTEGIIHGDIHSSNVMIEDAEHVRIIDLGYSRQIDFEENEVLPFGGVTHYMPPERIKISNVRQYSYDADLYSDVYQVGILIYIVLYKNLPFNGFVWEELARNIKQVNPLFGDTSFSGYTVPKALISIAKKCMEKNPSDRYNNAENILQDFQLNVLNKELQVN